MFKPMGKVTLAKAITRLNQSIGLFSVQNFHNSVIEIKKIKKELQDNKNPVILDNTFRVLQTTFIVEYNTTSHRIECSDFFKRRYNTVMKVNVKGLNNRTLDRNWLDLMEQRAKARKIIIALDQILMYGMNTDYDKAVGFSYDYLSHIDGLYNKDLMDFIIFDMLSKLETVDFNKIKKMNIADIKDYFKRIPKSSCLFDGWNNEIRNAIAHSSFWYDEKKKKIIFEERRKNHVHERTIDELIDMKEKLSDISVLVLCYNEILAIDKVVSDLIRI